MIFLGWNLMAQPEIPSLRNYATDQTSSITAKELLQLNLLLSEFEKTDSIQMVFLMVNSIGNYPLEKYAQQITEKNRIGYRDYNNGILVILLKEENKFGIFPGYIFQKVIQPPLISSIRRNVAEPNFRTGKYFEGIKNSIEALIDYNRGDYRKVKKTEYILGSDSRSTRAIQQIIIIFLILIPFFSKKGRGLGTLFFRRALSGRKRFDSHEFRFTGLLGEKEQNYGKFGGLFAQGGPLRSSVRKFKGKIISGKW